MVELVPAWQHVLDIEDRAKVLCLTTVIQEHPVRPEVVRR
jgi:hypothetical protein